MTTYDQGEVVVLTYTTTVGGVLTDATSTVLTLTDPTGAVTTPAVVHDSVGTYHVNVDTTAGPVGAWGFRWVSTGTAQSASDGRFTVVASESAHTFAQVSDVRANANDVTTHPTAYLFRNLSDAQLLAKLTAAARRLERKIGRRLVTFTRTTSEAHAYPYRANEAASPAVPDYRFTQVNPPLSFYVDETPGEIDDGWTLTVKTLSVLSDGGTAVTVDVSTVTTDPYSGRVIFPTPTTATLPVNGGCRVTVTYTAGFSGSSPEDLVEANILEAAQTFLVGVNATDGGLDAADMKAVVDDIVATWSLVGSKRGGSIA